MGRYRALPSRVDNKVKMTQFTLYMKYRYGTLYSILFCYNSPKNCSCRLWKCSAEQEEAAFTASSFLSSRWLISFSSSSLSLLISHSYAAICK